jgi:methionine synthase I (cobalamin-dependent)
MGRFRYRSDVARDVEESVIVVDGVNGTVINGKDVFTGEFTRFVDALEHLEFGIVCLRGRTVFHCCRV